MFRNRILLGGWSRIERLEPDNAMEATTKRTVSADIARTIPEPFPLHLFSEPRRSFGTVAACPASRNSRL